MSNKDPRKPRGRESIEARLRRLPQPQPPPRLEARLLSAIPAGRGAARPGRSVPWRAIAAGMAAAAAIVLLFVARAGQDWNRPQRPNGLSTITAEMDVRRAVEREAISARLLAAARILARRPGGQGDAAKTYQHIARTYADTSAARQIVSLPPRQQGDAP